MSARPLHRPARPPPASGSALRPPPAGLLRLIARIPRGHVATYGQLARLHGGCGARQVGSALANLPDGSDLPWHRVVNSRGALSPRASGSDGEQRRRLEAEGVLFDGRARIDLERFRWRPEGDDDGLLAFIEREGIEREGG